MGCVAQGETITEVQSNIIEAVEVWLETASDIDADLPRPALRATFNVLVDDDKLIPA